MNHRSAVSRVRKQCALGYLQCFMAAIFVIFAATVSSGSSAAQTSAPSKVGDLDAWSAANAMGIGINIGNTLENTATWETGWGNPPITREYIESLKALGFNTVRVPVAWDTYAHDGRIDRDKLRRVGEVADWITSQGMFCVINIHWDGGWIDSDDQKRFAKTYHTFSPEAERKFQSYWSQIANYFADRDQHLVFESLNEESNFEKVGSEAKAYAILAHVNQLFVDTVRRSGGNNAKRQLIVAGYGTDFEKTSSSKYVLPKDEVPHKMLISVHYYTPWPFAGMTHDESWGKMRPTWGTSADIDELNRLFDSMEAFSKKNDIPVFVGEFAPAYGKDPLSRARWMLGVTDAAMSRNMVPVLWEIGQDISRRPPYPPSVPLKVMLQKLRQLNAASN
jgi:endoglucanase